MMFADSVNSNKFITFLRKILKTFGDDKFVLYLDSLRVHLSIKVTAFMREHNIETIWAPVYSPWFQPVEYYISKVKRIIKRERLNDLVNDKDRGIRYLIQ